MGIISKPNTFSANTNISSSEVNADFDIIYNAFNGNIEAANLASNAVVEAKIADNAVTANKLASNAVTTAKVLNGSITAPKLTATYYQANVSSAGAVTSASFANFPTNRCKVDVVTANANAVIEVSYRAVGAYAGATGSTYLQFTLAGDNTGTSTYEGRGQNSDSSQRITIAYTEILTLASAGTTTVEMQIRGSASSSCNAEDVILTVKVLQDKG